MLLLEFLVRYKELFENYDSLGIKKVRINKYCSLLSAYGIALADVVSEVQQPLGMDYQEG